MSSTTAARTIQEISSIPDTHPAEAHALMQTAYERLMQVVESLSPEDWSKPTACTAWDVRAMLAHQAGGFATGTGYLEMMRQYITLPKKGQLPEDAVNALQVRERASMTREELVAELRRIGPIAARKWAYAFRLAKLVSIPHPVMNPLPLRHLFMVIHSRDTWMHRMDICRATGKPFEQTTEHDGRIAALVMRDVQKCLGNSLAGRALLFELDGLAGGAYLAGQREPAATIHMDMLDFNYFASGRYTYTQARTMMEIDGDTVFAETALQKILVLY